MKQAPLPKNELDRLEVLRSLDILDTEAETCFDEITKFAAKICDVPIALISLVDEQRQWFKSSHGLNATETGRDVAFCSHAILDKKTFIIEDSRLDDRFSDNPLVTGEAKVIFYAGQPLELGENIRPGTLCVIDHQPKKLTQEQIENLEVLAHQVEVHLKLRIEAKNLRAALATKDEFLANMAHELRTPLAGITGLTELISYSKSQDEHAKYLSLIQSSTKHLLHLIGDILDLAKISSGKFELEQVDIHLQSFLEETTSILQGTCQKNKNQLKLELQPDLPSVITSDSHRLRQILNNLIGNANKFSHGEDIDVIIKRGKLENQLLFSIRDRGIGIPEEKLNTIFESFRQADQSTTRKYGGTGLGLTICKKLARSFSGDIMVQSQVGTGSTFTFSILCSFKETIESPIAACEQALETQVTDRLKQIKVLLCEDNLVGQEVASGFLNKLGISHDIVGNGFDAIEKIKNQNYDLILMDSYMPLMGGIETTHKIRKIPDITQPKIIALTADSIKGAKESFLNAGMDDYITKPISLASLACIIHDQLKKP